jgi:DNA-directed RNA polymerase subunit RPC12/RpoP
MSRKFISPKNYTCERCGKQVPAYYTLSNITKGLWIQCPKCGTHARTYVANLDLPYKPSKSYLAQVGNAESGPEPARTKDAETLTLIPRAVLEQCRRKEMRSIS